MKQKSNIISMFSSRIILLNPSQSYSQIGSFHVGNFERQKHMLITENYSFSIGTVKTIPTEVQLHLHFCFVISTCKLHSTLRQIYQPHSNYA